MKTKVITQVTVLLISMLSLAIMIAQPIRHAKAQDRNFPGFLDEVGTYFEITDSTYLNVVLTSTEIVHVTLHSIPSLVSFFIESKSSANSTTLIFSGFGISTTYYRYENSYLVEGFTTDSNGGYIYTQDISEGSYVLISEEPSTLSIHSDYTFTHDIREMIYVWGGGFVIDGNGYKLEGFGYGYGFYFLGATDVTIKNVTVKNWGLGIYMMNAYGCTIKENTIIDNIELGWKWGIFVYGSYNLIYHNNFVNNGQHAIDLGVGTQWYHADLLEGNYWDDYTGEDLDGDGAGDTNLPHLGLDWYPLMIPSLWKMKPSEFMQLSIDTINSWNLAANGFTRGLTGKLEDAIILYNQGNINGAIHKLQDLITKVTNDAKYLTPEQKNYLIVSTQKIISRMQG